MIMNKTLSFLLATVLSACSPQISSPKKTKSFPAVPASYVVSSHKRSIPKPKPASCIPKDIEQTSRSELEKAITLLLTKGNRQITRPDDATTKRRITYTLSLDGKKNISCINFSRRTLSFIIEEDYSNNKVFYLTFKGVFGPGKQYYLTGIDGVESYFDRESLSFRSFQVAIDGFPEYEDSNLFEHSDLVYAIIDEPDPKTYTYGSYSVNLLSATVRDMAGLLPKNTKTLTFPEILQKFGYPKNRLKTSSRQIPIMRHSF